MIHLNPQQHEAVETSGNVLVTACPGSGKTRVLSARVIRGLGELRSRQERVVAMTYTNRASDEIQSRLDRLDVPSGQLWAGTIHAFALDWILRPYAPYVKRLRQGFSVADEHYTRRVLSELRTKHGQTSRLQVNIARNRSGVAANADPVAAVICEEYQQRLEQDRLIDYGDILYLAHHVLEDNQEVAATIGSIVRLFCVDEIQDTQDLQFAILSHIFRASVPRPELFFVGDADQCIFESLGAVLKSPQEIADEFGLESLTHLELSGNYRSTQRIIDFYHEFRPDSCRMDALGPHAREPGMITFHNGSVAKEDLPVVVARLIQDSLDAGISMNEICILAPWWTHVRSIGRALVSLLPDVDFDAPGLSPIHCQRENFWFKVARLYLTEPKPSLYRTRMRWASEVIRELDETYGLVVHEAVGTPRRLLREMNAVAIRESDGLAYLSAAFGAFTRLCDFGLDDSTALREAQESFFDKANAALAEIGDEAIGDVDSFRRLFRHPSGVVVQTCHGVKGEEYETVIAFGLLYGLIPHWDDHYNQTPEVRDSRAARLLFVVCSRAKSRLHLVAECNRFSGGMREYQTTPLLGQRGYDYDQLPH